MEDLHHEINGEQKGSPTATSNLMEDAVIINMGHNDQDNVITEKPHSRAITRDDAAVPSPNVEISNTSIRFGQEKDSIDSSTKVIQVNQTSSWKNEELEDCIYDDFTNMALAGIKKKKKVKPYRTTQLRKRKFQMSNGHLELEDPSPKLKNSEDERAMIDVVSNYKNYKKLGNIDDCGPTCDCYYCALLNLRTDKDTDEENEDYSDISDDEEADEQNLSVKHVKWGYDTIKMSSSSENISGKPKLNLSKSKSKRQNHENSTQKDLRSRKKRKAKEECTSGQCQCKPIIQEVPRFVRDFENAMKQAREDSLYEDIADTLVGFWVKLLNFIWLICTETYRIVRGRTKIYPIPSIHSTEERETMSQKTKPPADWPSRVLHL